MGFHWREAERALGLPHDRARQNTLFTALRIEGGDLRKRPWGWSRGMRQRFVIAMALIGTPDLLTMDEPTSALDPVVAADTMDLLDTYLSDRTTALLLVTHDLGLVAHRVNRIMVMEDGRIVEDAPTLQFLSAPQTQAAKSLCAHRNWLELPC
jgi:ABC-type dipeptide/oligopeptide/nickel transport system ATPase component